MTTTLITGANRGLGFEVARQLTAAGHQVWIGARDQARGQQAADTLGVRFVQLDVTDYGSVAAATETVAALDVLVNNAGISGGRISPSEATVEHMRTVYETNVFGPVRLLRAEFLMSSSSGLRMPEGPGSVSGTPNLPEGFADTFTSRYVEAGDVHQHAVIGGDGRPRPRNRRSGKRRRRAREHGEFVADDVQTLVIPDCGHWLAERAPEKLLAALTGFLSPYRDDAAKEHATVS